MSSDSDFHKAYAYDWSNKMRYPIWYQERGTKLVLKWNQMPRTTFHQVKEEVKGCEDARWDPESKSWTLKHPSISLRNANVLGLLGHGTIPHTNKDPFYRYRQEVQRFPIEIPGITYYNFQHEDLPWIFSYKRVLIGYDMGLGKTIMGLSTMEVGLRQLEHSLISADISRDHQDLFWVIAPRGPLNAWHHHLKRYGGSSFEVKPQLIMNSPQAIKRAMNNAPHPPFVLVVDESANIKNPKAQRTQLIFEMSRLMSHFWGGEEYILPMTGTPAPKDPTDWHAQIEILCPGFIRERTPAKLKQRLGTTKLMEGPHGSYYKLIGWNTDEIRKFSKRLEPIRSIRFKSEVAADLPEKQHIVRELTPDSATISAGKLAAKQLSGAELWQALRQISDGFLYEKDYVETDEGFKKRRVGTSSFHCPKDDALNDDLEELEINGRTRVVIYAGFQGSIDKCVKTCVERGWSVIQADGRGISTHRGGAESDGKGGTRYSPETFNPGTDVMTEFQDRNLDKRLALVAHVDSMGEGLTLTASDTMIFYSNGMRGDKRIQAEERIHRIDMDKNVSPRIIDYINLPTDKSAMKNLRDKKNLQDLSMGKEVDEMEAIDLEGDR